jgi:hypothetical protein
MMDLTTTVVKFLPLHEIAVLEVIWGQEMVRKSYRYKFVNRRCRSPKEEYELLCVRYPRDDVEVAYGEEFHLLGKAMRRPLLAYLLQKMLDMLPRKAVVRLEKYPQLPPRYPHIEQSDTPLEAMNKALEAIKHD